MRVRWGNMHKSHIKGQRPTRSKERGNIRQKDRRIAGAPGIGCLAHIFSYKEGTQAEMAAPAFIGVRRGAIGMQMHNLHVGECFAPCHQRLNQRGWRRAGALHKDSIPGGYRLYGCLSIAPGSHTLLLISFVVLISMSARVLPPGRCSFIASSLASLA